MAAGAEANVYYASELSLYIYVCMCLERKRFLFSLRFAFYDLLGAKCSMARVVEAREMLHAVQVFLWYFDSEMCIAACSTGGLFKGKRFFWFWWILGNLDITLVQSNDEYICTRFFM